MIGAKLQNDLIDKLNPEEQKILLGFIRRLNKVQTSIWYDPALSYQEKMNRIIDTQKVRILKMSDETILPDCPFCGGPNGEHTDSTCPRFLSEQVESLSFDNEKLTQQNNALQFQLSKLNQLRFAIYPNINESENHNRLAAGFEGRTWLKDFKPEEIFIISARLQAIITECNSLIDRETIRKRRDERAKESFESARKQSGTRVDVTNGQVVERLQPKPTVAKPEPRAKLTNRDKAYAANYKMLAHIRDESKRAAKAEAMTTRMEQMAKGEE